MKAPDKIWINDEEDFYPHGYGDCSQEEELMTGMTTSYTRTSLLSDPAYLASVDGWISVEDRLPDVGGQKPAKLMWLIFDGHEVSTTTVHPGNWNRVIIGKTVVTHWKPLPSPPKEEG